MEHKLIGKQLVQKAEAWINPLIEKGNKAETVGENVDVIRSWVVGVGRVIIGEDDTLTYRKRLRKRFGNARLTFIYNATDKNDHESVSRLGFGLKIAVVLGEVPADGKKSIDLAFRHGDPKSNVPAHENVDPEELFCHIFANDTKTGAILGTEWRKISDLFPEELEMVYDLTNTALGFIPQSYEPQTT